MFKVSFSLIMSILVFGYETCYVYWINRLSYIPITTSFSFESQPLRKGSFRVKPKDSTTGDCARSYLEDLPPLLNSSFVCCCRPLFCFLCVISLSSLFDEYAMIQGYTGTHVQSLVTCKIRVVLHKTNGWIRIVDSLLSHMRSIPFVVKVQELAQTSPISPLLSLLLGMQDSH